MNVNLKSLIGRLNDTCREALEGGAGLCLSRTNYDVEIEHILAKLLEHDDTDLHKICAHYEVNVDRLSKDVQPAHRAALPSRPVFPAEPKLSISTLRILRLRPQPGRSTRFWDATARSVK